MLKRSVWIGYDPREADAYAVTRASLLRHMARGIDVRSVELGDLRAAGLYRRPTSVQDGRLWDHISGAPMATEFACARFLVPHLAGSGWALFMDCDMLVRTDIARLFDACDPSKAVMVVKHRHQPATDAKMDGQVQSAYPRKNWSSVCAFQVDHPANKALTVDLVNTLPGRDLHAFRWLPDDLIGELDASWNWLVGHSDPEIDPGIVHFTEGGPWLPEYADVPYADEWRAELERVR
jgi:lipopolysaccharide biosynthesis glycosyltransferase